MLCSGLWVDVDPPLYCGSSPNWAPTATTAAPCHDTPQVYIPPARKIVSFPDPNPRPRLPAAVMVWDTGPGTLLPLYKTFLHCKMSLSTYPTFLPLTSFALQWPRNRIFAIAGSSLFPNLAKVSPFIIVTNLTYNNNKVSPETELQCKSVPEKEPYFAATLGAARLVCRGWVMKYPSRQTDNGTQYCRLSCHPIRPYQPSAHRGPARPPYISNHIAMVQNLGLNFINNLASKNCRKRFSDAFNERIVLDKRMY